MFFIITQHYSLGKKKISTRLKVFLLEKSAVLRKINGCRGVGCQFHPQNALFFGKMDDWGGGVPVILR